jgi:hypothetical protein
LHLRCLLMYPAYFSFDSFLSNLRLLNVWQFKLAPWLGVYNYVKNKHVRAEAVAYLYFVVFCLENIIYRGIGGPYGAVDCQRAELYEIPAWHTVVRVDCTI